MSFDSHCHLTADAFRDDLDEVVGRAREAGVEGMVCIASTPDDGAEALARMAAYPDVWCTAGLHPHEAGSARDGWVDKVRGLLAHPRVVAVGECGLDFHYSFSPRETQLDVLHAQAELAAEVDLPLVIHAREADAEMTAFLRALPSRVRGVLHCFSSGDALLDAGLERDWYVSFSGMVTFKRFDALAQVRRVPRDRILVETDAPYLAPVPFRGKRKEPARVVHTTARVAEIRGEPLAEFAARAAGNARAFYRLGEGVDGAGGSATDAGGGGALS